jgi:hypothetical protein
VTPQRIAGATMLPPVSLPIEKPTRPAAVAAPGPALEPKLVAEARGAADALGLRLRYHDSKLHSAHAPADAEAFEREKDIYRAQAAATGKPPQVVEKIVEGKMSKFYEEVCLLEQPFIRDQTVTIGQLVATKVGKLGENIAVSGGTIADVEKAFMASPEHYANIMGPYHYVATAWVVASNGYGYIAVEFS